MQDLAAGNLPKDEINKLNDNLSSIIENLEHVIANSQE